MPSAKMRKLKPAKLQGELSWSQLYREFRWLHCSLAHAHSRHQPFPDERDDERDGARDERREEPGEEGCEEGCDGLFVCFFASFAGFAGARPGLLLVGVFPMLCSVTGSAHSAKMLTIGQPSAWARCISAGVPHFGRMGVFRRAASLMRLSLKVGLTMNWAPEATAVLHRRGVEQPPTPTITSGLVLRSLRTASTHPGQLVDTAITLSPAFTYVSMVLRTVVSVYARTTAKLPLVSIASITLAFAPDPSAFFALARSRFGFAAFGAIFGLRFVSTPGAICGSKACVLERHTRGRVARGRRPTSAHRQPQAICRDLLLRAFIVHVKFTPPVQKL